MALNKNQFVEMTRKILRHSEGLRDQPIMHPTREWFIGLISGVVLFICIAGASGYTYWSNKEVNISYPDEAPIETVYRDSQVKDALKYYRVRDADRASLVSKFSGSVPAVVATTTTAASSGTTTPETTKTATTSLTSF